MYKNVHGLGRYREWIVYICLCVWIEFINKNRVGSLERACECQQASSRSLYIVGKAFLSFEASQAHTKSAQIKIDWVKAAAATPATNRMIYTMQAVYQKIVVLFYFYIIHIFFFFFFICGVVEPISFSALVLLVRATSICERYVYVLRGWWIFFFFLFSFPFVYFINIV